MAEIMIERYPSTKKEIPQSALDADRELRKYPLLYKKISGFRNSGSPDDLFLIRVYADLYRIKWDDIFKTICLFLNLKGGFKNE